MSSTDAWDRATPCLSSSFLAARDEHCLVGEEATAVGVEPANARRKSNVTVLVAAAARAEAFSAAELAAAIADGVRATLASARVLQVPDIDTGTCFIEQVAGLANGRIERISLLGPHGELVLGQLGLIGGRDNLTAVIAAEEAVDLPRGMSHLHDPTSASSRAIGQLIVAALDRGARRIIVGCGSSGTYDGGIGMAGSLGVRFFDAGRAEIVEAGGLLRLAAIDTSRRDPRLATVSIQAVVDPAQRLLGPGSIARTHGPGHGASPSQVLRIEHGLARFAKVVQEGLGMDVAALPGAGAAGGLAAGLAAFAGATVVSRSDFLDHFEALQANLAAADMVIIAGAATDATRESSPLPAGSDIGHACAWLERKAAALGLPVIALSLERLLETRQSEDNDQPAASDFAEADRAGRQSLVRGSGTRLHAASAASLRRALGGWQRPAEST